MKYQVCRRRALEIRATFLAWSVENGGSLGTNPLKNRWTTLDIDRAVVPCFRVCSKYFSIRFEILPKRYQLLLGPLAAKDTHIISMS